MILTIITINLNNRNGLEKTIESVINQKNVQFEYLVIDGSSTDGSVEVIKEYSNKIDYWISEKDSGIYNAMNKGITKAKGEYLLFLNSGDYLISDESLRNCQKELISCKKDIVYFDLLFEMDYGRLRRETFPKKLNFNKLFFGYLPHPAAFIKRNLFFKIGFYDEKLKIISDWKFFILAIIKHKSTYQYFPKLLTVYNQSGLSSNPNNKILIETETAEFLNEFFPEKQNIIRFKSKIRDLFLFYRLNNLLKRFRKSIFLIFKR